MDKASGLTEEQVKYFLNKVSKDKSKCKPVRFQLNGRTMNISTGELQERGINVIHQYFYWNFTNETANEIGRVLTENNRQTVKVVF